MQSIGKILIFSEGICCLSACSFSIPTVENMMLMLSPKATKASNGFCRVLKPRTSLAGSNKKQRNDGNVLGVGFDALRTRSASLV